jgi:hypothetical protein
MRKKRYFMPAAKVAISLGVLILVGSAVLAYSSSLIVLPVAPSLLLGMGFLSFIILTVLGLVFIWYDTSWATPLHREQMPYTPDRETIARVVRTDGHDREYFVYATPTSTVREAIQEDWPFKSGLKTHDWFVIDEIGNDVSEKMFSEVEGILKVVFE